MWSKKKTPWEANGIASPGRRTIRHPEVKSMPNNTRKTITQGNKNVSESIITTAISPFKNLPDKKTSVHEEIILASEGLLDQFKEGKHKALEDLTYLIDRYIPIIYVHFDDKGIYWYYDREEGIYVPKGKKFLLKIGKSIFAHRISQNVLRSEFVPGYRTIIHDCMQDPDIWETKDYQVIGNGVIIFPSLEVIPHDPKYYAKNKVNANHSEKTSCPALDKWMDERFNSEKDKILFYQFLGLILDPRNTFHK